MFTGATSTKVVFASGAEAPIACKLTEGVDIVSISRLNGKWYGFSSGQAFI